MERINTPEETSTRFERATEDARWFLAHEEELHLKYPNKYIAVKEKKVVFSADTPEEMAAKTQAAGEDLNDLLCRHMGKEPNCLLL